MSGGGTITREGPVGLVDKCGTSSGELGDGVGSETTIDLHQDGRA